MRQTIQEFKKYEVSRLDIETAPDLLPQGEEMPQARPSSVWFNEESRHVMWRMEEGDWFNFPIGKEGYAQSIEACFPDFLELAKATTSEAVANFVEKWGALELYPQDCTVNDCISAKGESVRFYLDNARWCASVLNIAADLHAGQSGAREDWDRVILPGRCTPPPYEQDLDSQDGHLLQSVSWALIDNIAPSLRRIDGQVRVMASRLPSAFGQRSWDKAQEEGKPLTTSTINGVLLKTRPSQMWAAITWRLASILATPAGITRCKECNDPFPIEHNRQVYCPEHGDKSYRLRQRVKKYREKQPKQK